MAQAKIPHAVRTFPVYSSGPNLHPSQMSLKLSEDDEGGLPTRAGVGSIIFRGMDSKHKAGAPSEISPDTTVVSGRMHNVGALNYSVRTLQRCTV